MSMVKPPSVASPNRTVPSEVRKERTQMRGTFGAFRRPPVVGVSDTVAQSNREMARSARRAEKAWMKSLSKAQRERI